ncbi:hypothetical protein E2C01_074893 [Portunus trituberculatus]|uniref:Uncharacterized protein n=1 Tax=Portunus trituberculatus TaxID=210409 RepID=A0A5B7IEC8_PORTR|nr:hypothetical protein [Portunus trituberculatus]
MSLRRGGVGVRREGEERDTLTRFFSLTSPAFTSSHPPEGHPAFLPRYHATTRGTTPPSITLNGAWQSSRDKSRQLHLHEWQR